MAEARLPGSMRDRLIDLMSEQHMTRATLAAKIGVSESNISRFFKDPNANLDDRQIIRIARIFNVSTDFLLEQTLVPDRKNYTIDELGLTPQAARNLYAKEIDTTVVSYLLENPTFAMTAEKIALYMQGAVSAGYMSRNVIQKEISKVLLRRGMKVGARQLQAMLTPPYEQELGEIQSSFLEAVQEIKTDVEYETSVETMTKKQMDEMLASFEKSLSGKKKPSMTPKEFSTMVVAPVEEQGMLRPETVEKLREALEAVAEDLQESDRRAQSGQ